MAEKTWLDEQELIQGLRARDPLSLEALINRYSRELFYFTRLILAGAGSAQDAEECLNDLFITVWQEIESFDPARGSLRAWLTMRAKYIALDCRRLLHRQQPAGLPVIPLEYAPAQDQRPSERPLPRHAVQMQPMMVGVDALLEQQERCEELGRALEQLSELDRLIVYLRYFQFAGIREIAARTGLTKHAVEARLWRARKVLRQALQEPTSHPLGQRRQRASRRASLRVKRRGEETLSMVARPYRP